MLYPQKLTSKKSDTLIRIFIGISVVIAIVLVIINKITTPDLHWAALVNAGMIYAWVTVIYAIHKHTNIAAHVMLQTIGVSCLTVYIDYKLGFQGWSFDISIPIMVIIANITMLVLTIISHKKFLRYAIYQLIICAFSLGTLFWVYEGIVHQKTLSYIASSISLINFIVTLCLCAKDVKEEIIRKFHL